MEDGQPDGLADAATDAPHDASEGGPWPDVEAGWDVAQDADKDGGKVPSGPGVFPFGECQPGDPEARFVAEGAVPSSLLPGQVAATWVVFANCGAASWHAGPAVGPAGYKLGALAPQDNAHWGFQRAMLPGDVEPNEMVRVDFSITAPSQPGSWGYQWQIVNEGVAWLEQASPLHQVAVQSTTGVASLAHLWDGSAHFVVDQDPVPVTGASSGHREAFAVNRPDISPTTMYLYHRCFGQSGADASICLSISHDGGDSFAQFVGEVVGPDPGHIFSVAPTVIKKGSSWFMVYEESHVAAVYWAESPDGIDWTKKGQLLSKDAVGWDSGAMATPGAFMSSSGTIYVFYAGFPLGGTHMSIGYASGPSMTTLQKFAGNPVHGPSSGWSQGQVSMPRVVEQGGHYYLIHEGANVDYTCEGYNRYGWGMARSTDLSTWENFVGNPLGQANSGCGNDMPSLFIRYDSAVFAYHTSVDVKRIVRERLVFK